MSINDGDKIEVLVEIPNEMVVGDAFQTRQRVFQGDGSSNQLILLLAAAWVVLSIIVVYWLWISNV